MVIDNETEKILTSDMSNEVLNDITILPCGNTIWKTCPHVNVRDLYIISLYRRYKRYINAIIITSNNDTNPFNKEYIEMLLDDEFVIPSIDFNTIVPKLNDAYNKSITEKDSIHILTTFYRFLYELYPFILDKFEDII